MVYKLCKEKVRRFWGDMMDDLYIRWDYGRGNMVIILDKFFPTTKKNLKKLLSVIALDWEHESELKEKLKVYFQEKQQEHETGKKKSARQHLDYRQREADTKQIVLTKKRPNGVPLSVDELKEEKERLKLYKNTAARHLSEYKQHDKEEKQFSEYLKLL